jgi:serine protease AprX
LELPTKAIDAIARTPGVISVSYDAPLLAQTVPVTDGVILNSTLGYVAADGLTGAGVGVAIIDSGLSASADFAGRITAFYDFTLPQGGAVSKPPTDPYGHGTHVAGLVGGNGSKSNGLYKGVAPGVSLIGLRVLGADGSGYTSDVIEAIEFATATAPSSHRRAQPLAGLCRTSRRTPTRRFWRSCRHRGGHRGGRSAGNDGSIRHRAARLRRHRVARHRGRALTVGSSHTMGTETADDEIGPYSSRGPRGKGRQAGVARATRWSRLRARQLAGVANPRCSSTARPSEGLPPPDGHQHADRRRVGHRRHDDRGIEPRFRPTGSDDQCDQGILQFTAVKMFDPRASRLTT